MSTEDSDGARRQRMNKLLQSQNIFDYISHDWEHDTKWKEHLEDASQQGKLDDRELEIVKRLYYNKNVDSRFDIEFSIDDEDERKQFFHLCRYQATLGALNTGYLLHSEKASNSMKLLLKVKYLFYALFLIMVPISTSWIMAYQFYFVGFAACFFQRYSMSKQKHGHSTPFWQSFFIEEETLTFCNFILIVFSGPHYRLLLTITMIMWAFANVCEWGCVQLAANPRTVGIGPLKPLFERVRENKIDFIQVKSHLEVAVGITSCVLWIWGWCAPLFPIVYMQFLRLKYVTSMFTKTSFAAIDAVAYLVMPEFLYQLAYTPIKNWMSSQVLHSQHTDEEVKQDQLHKENETREKKNKRPNQRQSVDEPRTYEVNDSDLD